MRVDLSRVKTDWRTAAPAAFALVDGAAVDVMRLEDWAPVRPGAPLLSGFVFDPRVPQDQIRLGFYDGTTLVENIGAADKLAR